MAERMQGKAGASKVDRDERIRALAHAIWLEEGRPEGRAEQHWEMARRRVEAEERNAASLSPDPGGGARADADRAGRDHATGDQIGNTHGPAATSQPAKGSRSPAGAAATKTAMPRRGKTGKTPARSDGKGTPERT